MAEPNDFRAQILVERVAEIGERLTSLANLIEREADDPELVRLYAGNLVSVLKILFEFLRRY